MNIGDILICKKNFSVKLTIPLNITPKGINIYVNGKLSTNLIERTKKYKITDIKSEFERIYDPKNKKTKIRKVERVLVDIGDGCESFEFYSKKSKYKHYIWDYFMSLKQLRKEKLEKICSQQKLIEK